MKASKAAISAVDEQYSSNEKENTRCFGTTAANDASAGTVLDVSTSERFANTSLQIARARALQARSALARETAQLLMEHSRQLRDRFPLG